MANDARQPRVAPVLGALDSEALVVDLERFANLLVRQTEFFDAILALALLGGRLLRDALFEEPSDLRREVEVEVRV